MKLILQLLPITLGLAIIIPGLGHFVSPKVFDPFIPDFLPKLIVNYIVGFVEIILGIGLIHPKYRKYAALGTLLMMLAYLPIHTMDVFLENPAIGSKKAAYIRLPMQFVLIYWAWWTWKTSEVLSKNKKQNI